MKTTDDRMAAAFNEWLRRYEEEPERFEREINTLKQFREEEAAGEEPSYGRECVPYLHQILWELGHPAKDCPPSAAEAALEAASK